MFHHSAKIKLQSSTAALALALLWGPSAFAQNVADQPSTPPVPPSTTVAPEAPVDAPPSDESGDVIVVDGIRATLEAALESRRLSDVIQDGISADDIGSTPDLNLGEALQRIPGVQINRESGRRDATISVRGLPGRFTKTTIMGQSVASTTRGQNTGNPFGIFDSSIFNGADVIKSFTADVPAGGLAANVNLKLNSALSRREGFVIRTELGFEETTEDANPSAFFSAAHKFSDSFGFYVNAAYSKQSFRRDSVRINGYTPFSQAPATVGTGANAVTTPARHQQLFPNIPLIGANGLANKIVYPDEIRQFSVTNDGYRVSGSAGMEWQPSDELSLRVDGIFTRRDLKNANNDIFSVSPTDVGGIVTPLSAARLAGVTDIDDDLVNENVYMVDRIQASDFQTIPGNRINPALDQSWAIYPQATWENDDWRVNVIGTYSKAIGEVRNIQLDVALRARTSNANGFDNRIDANGDGLDDRANGSTAIIDTGAGNWGEYLMDLDLPTALINGIFAPGSIYTIAADTIGAAFSIPVPRTIDGVPFNSSASLRLAANNERVDRNLRSIDFNIARKLEFGPINHFEIGGFYSKEDAEAQFYENGVIGAQLGNLSPGLIRLNDAVTSGGPFAGGLSGAELQQFYSLNLAGLQAALLPILRTAQPNVIFNPTAAQRANQFPELTAASAGTITPTEILQLIPLNPLSPGFAQRLALRRANSGNYDSDRRTIELFGMAKFDFEDSSDLPIRGNLGMRYINTKLAGQIRNPSTEFYDALAALRAQNGGPALVFRNGGLEASAPAKSSFKAWLPSANMIVDITDNLQLRAAYYHTFEALDLAEFSPAPTQIQVQETDLDDLAAPPGPFTLINFASFDVRPRKSRAIDIGFSWYNRPGGLFAINVFKKSLIDDISRFNNFCPIGGTITADGRDYGPLTLIGGRCFFTNTSGVQERVRINLSQNNPNTINVRGIEAQIQQRFDFLPGFLRHTGGVINYTRVRSGGAGGTRLFNVAEDTYNIIGYYEHDWLQMRMAWNHQSEIQLQGGGSFTGGATRVAARGQLDFSGAIRPTKNFEVRFEAFNLNNSKRKEYVGVESIPRVYDYDGRTYSVSATLKF
jgi:TonB-dependent receptor